MSLSVVALVAGLVLLLAGPIIRVLPNRQSSGIGVENFGCLLIVLAVVLILIGL